MWWAGRSPPSECITPAQYAATRPAPPADRLRRLVLYERVPARAEVGAVLRRQIAASAGAALIASGAATPADVEPILSDPDKSVARAYGVMTASGFPARWTFYIGKDGRILAIDKHVRTATHGADITSNLDSMKATGQG